MHLNTFKRICRHFSAAYWDSWRHFPPETLSLIQQTITESELTNMGEIKIAIEAALNPLQLLQKITAQQRALEVFAQLRVWDTEHNNGVLIYLLLGDHAVEIITDRGINNSIRKPVWHSIAEAMQQAFARGDYANGAICGIINVAQELAQQYPQAEMHKQNQLSDNVEIL